MTRIDPAGEGLYRISTFNPQIGITFNQFLVVDERPALIHTGIYQAYEAVRDAVAQVIDPAKLAYVVIPHFEADECGGMARFVEQAPGCQLICSDLGAALNLGGWAYVGPFRGVRDGDVLELGRRRLRFWETPHVHHWDSMMVYEETLEALFPADLFIQPGDQPPVVREDLARDMCALYRGAGIFAAAAPVLAVADRVERVRPRIIHPMHGGSLHQDVVPRYIGALRAQPFCYEGKLLGRAIG